jgi:hypothetical protein
MSSCYLLDLPRELRDDIYAWYLLADSDRDDAYVYNFETNKLRRADKQSIDLGLMYTCKTVAAEMRGMPLRLNTVTFRTIYSDRLRTIAGRFHDALARLEDEIVDIFDRAAPKMDSRKMKPVFDRFPILKAGLPDYHRRPPIDLIYNRSWPEVSWSKSCPNVSSYFVNHVQDSIHQNTGVSRGSLLLHGPEPRPRDSGSTKENYCLEYSYR